MIKRCSNYLSERKLLISLLLSLVLALNMIPTVMTKVSASPLVYFEENFDSIEQFGNFPAGWKLVNVDGRTPFNSTAYVNNAWIIREDFKFNVDNMVMFSTSWYTPVGASDDWVWTPLISDLPAGATLSWSAVTYDTAYRDGYEVRIMTAPDEPTGSTGDLGNMVTNSTVIFSVSSENILWTTHSVDLSAYAGESVYIAFRNNSDDMFLLLIDDIKITYKAAPDAPPAPVMASRTDTSITLEEIDGAEYSMDNGATWQDSPVFSGLLPNTSYSFVARIKETEESYSSAVSAATEITTDKSATAAPSAPVMAGRTDTSITLEEIGGAEYSMDNGATWQDSSVFSGLLPNTSYSFVARIKETEESYSSAVSAAAEITTDKSATDAPSAPAMAGRTDTSITLEEIGGAEYSMDNGETWQDSPIFSGLSPNISYSFVARIKETESAYASAVSAASEITTDKSATDAPSAPAMAGRTDTSITLEEIDGAEYSMDNGETWQDSPVFSGLSPNTSYSFVARIKETEDSYASDISAAAEITTDKSATDAPSAPAMAGRTDTSITLEEIDGAEYSMDDGATWQDSPVFSGLSPNTSYSFVARIKETESAYASAVSAASKITTYGASNGSPETSDTMRTFRIVILIALMAASFSALVFVVRKRKTMKSPV